MRLKQMTYVVLLRVGQWNGIYGPLAVFEGHLYFAGSQTLVAGALSMLYKSDGTDAGTDYLRTGTGEPLREDIREIVLSQNMLYVATAGAIWVTDGTVEGSREILMPSPLHILYQHRYRMKIRWPIETRLEQRWRLQRRLPVL